MILLFFLFVCSEFSFLNRSFSVHFHLYGSWECIVFVEQLAFYWFIEQLWFILFFKCRSNYRTPLRGLYLCGSGAHPGGGVMGAPGRNAAHEVLKDFFSLWSETVQHHVVILCSDHSHHYFVVLSNYLWPKHHFVPLENWHAGTHEIKASCTLLASWQEIKGVIIHIISLQCMQRLLPN